MAQNTIETTKRPLRKIPEYIDRLPPCNNACPAGENIQAWLDCINKNKIYEAWKTLIQNNPMPAIHGRICYHPCENACNRKQYDSPVSIHCVERFLGDLALQEKWQFPLPAKNTDKKVLVVGAGPAGLACAYHLRKLGHNITIFEANSFAGGVMGCGIPSYRLPRDVLNGEIDRIKNMGVKIELNHKVTDVLLEKEKSNFDAVFLGIGAAKDKWTELSGANTTNVYGAMDFLIKVELKKMPTTGNSVIVYGGGNTAIDVARTIKRLGIPEVKIVYRRDKAHMPAFAIEIQEAEEEGIEFHVLRTIKSINYNKINLEIMALDNQGKPQSTNTFEEIEANSIVLALGQDPDTNFLQNIPGINIQKDSCIVVDNKFHANQNGIFAGGDAITQDRSVTIAVGHGKKAAWEIDAYLSSKEFVKPQKHEIADFAFLHLDQEGILSQKTDAAIENIASPEIRVKDFSEVVKGLPKDTAINEAKRCFSCGNCFECDGCFNICPVKAINKLGAGKRYKINLDTCIRCAKCFRRCPCGAIRMVEPP